MSDTSTCPHCGSELTPPPEGHCPRCRGKTTPGDVERGVAREEQKDPWATALPDDSHLSVLDSIAAELGPVVRVLLRDTGEDESGAPVVTPSSPEMPRGSSRLWLLGEIGHGGMGAVLKGRDPDLGRDVAVKVLLERHRDNPDLIRRFVEEAQIAGQLQHPGVVPVYEIGLFADDRPYFSMKLVKGRTLADVLHERTSPRLDLSSHLATWIQVCQTVAYAHARGVIHRDLKPANVMVGSFGEVQVMDWGLAKVLPRDGAADDASADTPERAETVIETVRSESDGDHSRAGSVLGTPAYMAPEQARGETSRVDERADVFALGSILCEVLTGQPAYTGRTATEVQRKATWAELTDALARLDASGADPDLIALARDCLAADRDARPRDARAVADRGLAYVQSIERRLRTAELERAAETARAEEAARRVVAETQRAEAETARAEEAGRRVVVERQRRHYQLGLAAAVLLLTTLGGLSYSSWSRQRQARIAREDLALREATLLRDQALASADDVAKWEAAVQAVAVAARDRPEGDAAARLAALKSEVDRGLTAARRDRVLVDALTDVRSSKEDLGLSGSDAAYTRAFREAGLDIDGAPPAEVGAAIRARPPSVVLAAAGALDDWALVRLERNRSDPRWRRPLEVARAADPDPFRDQVRDARLDPDARKRADTLRALAADPKAIELPPPSALLLALTLKDRPAAVGLLRGVAGRHPEDVWVNYHLAVLLGDLRPAPREEQVRYYSAARALRPETGHDLAHLLNRMDRSDEALAIFADLVDRRPSDGRHLGCYGGCLKDHGRSGATVILDRAVAALRTAIRLQPDDATVHHNLGLALQAQKKLDEAVTEYRAAIRLQPDDATAHNGLGAALKDQKKLDEAVTEFRAAIRLQPDLATAHYNLGIALQDQGKVDEAVTAYRAAIRLQPDYALAHNNLGIALQDQGKVDEAVTAYRAAIRLQPDEAGAHSNLGLALKAQGKLDEAMTEFRAAIRLQPDLALAHYNLGNILQDQGKIDEAETECRAAIRLKPDYAEAHSNLGIALHHQGKLEEAVTAYRAAIRLQPDLAAAHYNLGIALQDQGKVDEAVTEFRAAIRLQPDYALAHYNLGLALQGQGKVDEAVTEFRAAIRLQPDYALAHYNLGNALGDQGKVDEAVTAYRAAIRLKPDDAEAHCNLGLLIQQQGDYGGALEMLRKGHELGSKRTDWRYPSAQWVAETERMAALAQRLPTVLKGDDKPKDNAERLALAQMCYDTKRPAAAARFWAEALEADPMLGDDRRAQHRYNAACAAALAGTGQGKDDPPPDAAAKAKLRKQALDWLKAELAAWSKLLESGPPQARPFVVQTLQHWKVDTDLAAIRAPDALAKFPEAERKEWMGLWAEVDALLTKVAQP